MNDIATVEAQAETLPDRVEPERHDSSTRLMTVIERAANDPNFDVAKLEKLLEVQERWEANEARKAFNIAKSDFQAEVPTIDKTRLGHNTKYAGLAETLGQVRDLMAKYDLSHSWETKQDGDLITVVCHLTHSSGHREATALSARPDTSGNKNAIQAVGSTVSYLQRYTLFAVLGLASREQDDDGHAAGGLITAEQKDELVELLRQAKRDTKKLLAIYGVASLDEMPAANFAAAKAMLEAAKRQMEKPEPEKAEGLS